ncbi:hypothetical protein [Desmospora profundinema]|uniref:Uncharacterized protein n=1 Tax=Desmospora profundinema TaxID=1571184 RepID=A0ABU1II42_9BACL|nr:hypothetical protein [Desmospora profundinema]MDR6224438.1 hypothetical protein [Desmospora profundinema]
MSIRWPVAVTALVVALAVLFGGYTAYQWTQVDRPIEETVAQTPHVTLKKKEVSPDRISIRLETDSDFSLTRDYPSLREQLTTIAGGRLLEIELIDRPDDVLTQAWNEMLFGVKEGLANQQYSNIPEAVKTFTPSGAESQVAMDETHLYVEIKRGDARMYQILPLHKRESGVKDNG